MQIQSACLAQLTNSAANFGKFLMSLILDQFVCLFIEFSKIKRLKAD